jgi:hypothetical protein
MFKCHWNKQLFFNTLNIFNNMKSFIVSVVFLFLSVFSYAQSQTWVDGYYKKNGTYVQSHVRQTPNKTNHDNWSTQGQSNPYNGTQGTRAKDYSREANNYGQGKTIYVGPKGGQYYINDNGNKIYVPKR